jgi:hypothetical protein
MHERDFLCYNFKQGGATSQTMLNSHHWPGVAFTFLIMLLNEEGIKACDRCFSNEDVEEPNYTWDEAPPVDM